MSELAEKAQSVYENLVGKNLEEVDPHIIEGSLLSFRFLFDEALESGEVVLRDLFQMKATEKLVFPCEVVELRSLLDCGEINVGREWVPTFSLKFADKYLKNYPVFITLDATKITTPRHDFEGLITFDARKLGIVNAISRITVNEPSNHGVKDSVKNIIKDTADDIDFGVSNSIPVLSGPVQASENKQKKYASLNIPVNAGEARLFNRLKDLRDDAGLNNQIAMRVFGEWVRDKILGKDNDTLAIAIRGMTNREFTADTSIDSYAQIAGSEDLAHFDTVRSNISGKTVDFVSLKPDPCEDVNIADYNKPAPYNEAMFTDLTINSLFFNLETGELEDYCNGREDLTNMLLRTPVDPKKTFTCDPLSILRIMRHHSSYPDSRVDPNIITAMESHDIKRTCKKGLSRKKAGIQLKKIMQGKRPDQAMRVLFETGIYKYVFDVSDMSRLHDIQMEQKTKHHNLNLMEHTLSALYHVNKMMLEQNEDDDIRVLMNIAVIFHDLGKTDPNIEQEHPKNPGQKRYPRHEKRSAELASKILHRLGFGEKDRYFVRRIIAMHMRPHVDNWTKQAIRRFLHDAEIEGQGNVWRYVMLHAIADAMAKGDGCDEDVFRKQEHIIQFNDFLAKEERNSV